MLSYRKRGTNEPTVTLGKQIIDYFVLQIEFLKLELCSRLLLFVFAVYVA